MKDYLYILEEVNKENLLKTKIGVSNNVEKRIKTLQTGNYNLIKLYHSEERCDAYKIETKLKHFFSYAKNGAGGNEWYLVSPREVKKELYKLIF
jgi:hypothetical protein